MGAAAVQAQAHPAQAGPGDGPAMLETLSRYGRATRAELHRYLQAQPAAGPCSRQLHPQKARSTTTVRTPEGYIRTIRHVLGRANSKSL